MSTFLRKSQYLPALRLEKVLTQTAAGFIAVFFVVASFLSLFVSVVFFNERLLGLGLVLFAGFVLLAVYWWFLIYLKRDPYPEEYKSLVLRRGELPVNLLTFFATKALAVSSEGDQIFLKKFLLWMAKERQFIWVLHRLDISEEQFASLVSEIYQQSESYPVDQVLQKAVSLAQRVNHKRIRFGDLLIALFEIDQKFRQLMFRFKVKENDIYSVVYWQRRHETELSRKGKFWEKSNLLDIQGIGKQWAYGYTVFLDRIAYDITASTKKDPPPRHLYGRRNTLKLLQRTLLEKSGNAVIVGRPGSGRMTLIRVLADAVNKGNVIPPLRYKRVLQIDSSTILAGVKNKNEVVKKIEMIFGEAYRSENTILVIKDIDAFFDSSDEVGRVNAAEALIPFLESRLQVVGITTPQGYSQTIGRSEQLVSLTGKLELQEMSASETLLVLQDEVLELEKYSGVYFTHHALVRIAELTQSLIQNIPNPEKSLRVLDQVAQYVSETVSNRIATDEHVNLVLEEQTKVPLHMVDSEEKDFLMHLEEILHQRIIGQGVAVSELSSALRRSRSGVRDTNRPIGSFLFLGPTGVGKTETTKALASVYFGGEEKIIRLDMSEYQEAHALDRLIGNPDTKEGGVLTEAVITNPYSLIFLDEIEKAHTKVLDLLLQVLDDGRLTDSVGRTVNFTNTMIVATSNAGAQQIRKLIQENRDLLSSKEKILNTLQEEGVFRPEFLNRFDAVVLFKPLSELDVEKIAELLLHRLNERLSSKDIQIKVTKDLIKAVAVGAYDPEYGARPLRRYIQEHVENKVAEGLISGEIQRGDEVEIDPSELE